MKIISSKDQVDKQFIEKTVVSQQEIISALVASKPKSVTMFIDACCSGQTRSGEMMNASIRPLAVKSGKCLSFKPHRDFGIVA